MNEQVDTKCEESAAKLSGLFQGVPVMLQLWCFGDSDHPWKAWFEKLVTMPQLLPVGSEVYLDEKPNDGIDDGFEWPPFVVASYLWFEGEPFIRCEFDEALDDQECSLADFVCDIERRGWKRRQ